MTTPEPDSMKLNKKRIDEKTQAKEILDVSSVTNRNLFISFLLFIAFILTMVLSTTDVMLLIGVKQLKLPVIDNEISLEFFYLIGPLLVLAFHYNLLFNLIQHRKKLAHWRLVEPDGQGTDLYPFLFNFREFLDTEKEKRFLGFLTASLYYFSPLLTLIWMDFTYAKKHEELFLAYYFIIIVIDYFVIRHFWDQGQKVEGKPTYMELTETIVKSFYYFFSRKKGNFAHRLTVLYLVFFLFLAVQFVLISDMNKGILRINPNQFYFRILIPILKVNKREFVEWELKNRPVTDNEGPATKEAGYDLSNLNLQFAELEGLNLENVSLRNSKLDYAKFIRVNLVGATINEASMVGTDFTGSDLYRADFSLTKPIPRTSDQDIGHRANLKTTIFDHTNLQDSNFGWAQLQGASFQSADLSRANLMDANISKANLSRAFLTDTLLARANFTSSNLEGAELDRSDLYHSIMKGAKLFRASFENTNLIKVDLRGANLSRANLKGALIIESDLRLADLTGADFTGAILHSNQFWGASSNVRTRGTRQVENQTKESRSVLFLPEQQVPLTKKETSDLLKFAYNNYEENLLTLRIRATKRKSEWEKGLIHQPEVSINWIRANICNLSESKTSPQSFLENRLAVLDQLKMCGDIDTLVKLAKKECGITAKLQSNNLRNCK